MMRDPKRQTKCARMAAAKSTLFSFLSLSFFLFSSGVVEASVSSDAATTIEMHGSGTTNPSKYFWKAMDILEERAGKPVRMTYRAVGSGTGQTEFIGEVSDFGSADIPLSSTQHSGFAGTVVQVPFQLGAVSFFHNVAADDLGVAGRLNLTSCTLAKIFRRDITTWDDATIVAENPNLSVPAGQPITIIHRSDGSSSTYGITSYLSEACPDRLDRRRCERCQICSLRMRTRNLTKEAVTWQTQSLSTSIQLGTSTPVTVTSSGFKKFP